MTVTPFPRPCHCLESGPPSLTPLLLTLNLPLNLTKESSDRGLRRSKHLFVLDRPSPIKPVSRGKNRAKIGAVLLEKSRKGNREREKRRWDWEFMSRNRNPHGESESESGTVGKCCYYPNDRIYSLGHWNCSRDWELVWVAMIWWINKPSMGS